MEKLYERQIFEDDTAPDLSATNVNIWTKAIDEIDTRVCEILPADDYLELAQQTKEAAEEAKEAAERAHTTEVIVSPLVTEGTHIADISVNGHPTELYAPTGGGGVSASINGVPLVGNKTDAELGLASADQFTLAGSAMFLDEKDGKLGLNSDPNRGADTFRPFKSDVELPINAIMNQFGYESPITVSRTTPVLGTVKIDFTKASKIRLKVYNAGSSAVSYIYRLALSDNQLSERSEVATYQIWSETIAQTSATSKERVIDVSEITGEKYLSLSNGTTTSSMTTNWVIGQLIIE